MIISAIAAMSENRVIGKNNQLPWHLPADLKYFKSLTLNKSVLMGRKTYESIGRPLPNRNNIVITRESEFQVPGCLVAHSIEEALSMVGDEEEVFIIGGATIYQQSFPYLQRLYLTLVHKIFDGDAFFPEFNLQDWRETKRSDFEADGLNDCSYSFVLYNKI